MPTAVLLLLVLCRVPAHGADAFPPRPFSPDLRSFCGVNYVAPPEIMRDLGLGWARESFPIDWNAVEPEQDKWD